MGGDTYCLVCGAPTTTSCSKVSIFTDQLKKYVSKCSNKQIENNWQVDNIFYELFEEKIIDQEEYDHLMEKDNLMNLEKEEKYKWLTDLLILSVNGTVKSVTVEDSWEGEYTDKYGMYRASFLLGQYDNISDYQKTAYKKRQLGMYDPKSKHFFGDGYIIHKDCYKLINDKIPNFNFNNMCLQKINYNEIYPYIRQEIPWTKYFLNDKEYFLESPDINEQNRKRIIDIVESMKFIL